jgi:hypothetical protein
MRRTGKAGPPHDFSAPTSRLPVRAVALDDRQLQSDRMIVLAAAAGLLFFVVVKVRFDFSGIWAGRTVFVLALALDNLRPRLAKQTHQRPA